MCMVSNHALLVHILLEQFLHQLHDSGPNVASYSTYSTVRILQAQLITGFRTTDDGGMLHAQYYGSRSFLNVHMKSLRPSGASQTPHYA